MGNEQQIDLLTLESLCHQYPGGEKIHFPDVRILKGQHTLLLGNSGTGKTTLLHILTGLLNPTLGRVLINGQHVYELSTRKLDFFRGQQIGIVFQNAHLINSLNLYDNLRIAQEFAGKKHDTDRINETLDALGLLAFKHKFPKKLSRGQLQRAAIARAVINHPSLLVADEPTASLDDLNTERVMDLFFEQAAVHGATLLIATHDNRIKDRFESTINLNELKS
jgi:ABC-type lipoprotein export system ATPase subunit